MQGSHTCPKCGGSMSPSLLGIALTAALGVAGIVILYLAAGPVMEEGGFVACGGPYEIAHPAPDWVWLVPVSINRW